MPTISDLFTLQYGHSLELNRLERASGSDAINFVGRAARNNGVTAKVRRILGLSPAASGTITVALNGQGGAGVAFLQPFPYYCGFHVMVLTPKSEMTEAEKLWWAMCITANRFRFGFGRQANRSLGILPLPLPNEMPNWASTADVDQFNGADAPCSPKKISLKNIISWKPFILKNLFKIKKGKRLTGANMTDGTTPYIGAIDSNNGVSAFVGEKPIHDANTITVNYNGSVGEAYYQPVAFWATDDANVLYPRFTLTPNIAMFLISVIRLETYRFNYGRKWNKKRMEESVIRLPTSTNGQPDWQFMEGFIKGLPYSSVLQ